MSATSTTFTSAGRSLPTSATIVTGVTETPQAGYCAASANSSAYPITLPAGAVAPAAVKIFSTPASTGMGAIDLGTSFQLAVPQNAYAGNYTSTWTITIASGP